MGLYGFELQSTWSLLSHFSLNYVQQRTLRFPKASLFTRQWAVCIAMMVQRIFEFLEI
jgi:hypothetical protein